MKKYIPYFYIALFLLICLIPSAGLLLGRAEESAENRTAAKAPVLWDEKGVNLHVLSDAGAWFEDHFAFRNEWVTGYAVLTGKLFGASSQERVIVGKNGWLYYKDSLEDFQRENPMSERQLFYIAHSLEIVQSYAREKGIRFAFTIAPNKNSLYGGNMPYYYQAFRSEDSESNLTRLKHYLELEKVNYIDLYETFQEQEEVLYHTTDSHWNNKGAALAADRILCGLEKAHSDYTNAAYETRKDFEGDLAAMLYPAMLTKPYLGTEEEIYYNPEPQFTYQEEVESNFSPKIYTYSAGEGSLVMYRDSFGNALLPFLAEAYESAYFSRALPYHLSDLEEYGADTLIIERAERFLPDMAKRAPEMEAPEIEAQESVFKQDFVRSEIRDLVWNERDSYFQVTGKVGMERLPVTARLYIRINGGICYEAFPVVCEDGQEGFSLLIPAEGLRKEGNEFELYIR